MYTPTLHGVDWPGIRKTYEQLLPFVNHRTDLTYLIGEMIGELNIGHAYIGGGDYPKPERYPPVSWVRRSDVTQRDTSRWHKILKGQNWDKALRSPLTEIGVDVHEGDYILAVNGTPTNQMKDLMKASINTAEKQVTLTVNRKPEPAAAGRVVIRADAT